MPGNNRKRKGFENNKKKIKRIKNNRKRPEFPRILYRSKKQGGGSFAKR